MIALRRRAGRRATHARRRQVRGGSRGVRTTVFVSRLRPKPAFARGVAVAEHFETRRGPFRCRATARRCRPAAKCGIARGCRRESGGLPDDELGMLGDGLPAIRKAMSAHRRRFRDCRLREDVALACPSDRQSIRVIVITAASRRYEIDSARARLLVCFPLFSKDSTAMRASSFYRKLYGVANGSQQARALRRLVVAGESPSRAKTERRCRHVSNVREHPGLVHRCPAWCQKVHEVAAADDGRTTDFLELRLPATRGLASGELANASVLRRFILRVSSNSSSFSSSAGCPPTALARRQCPRRLQPHALDERRPRGFCDVAARRQRARLTACVAMTMRSPSRRSRLPLAVNWAEARVNEGDLLQRVERLLPAS